MSQAEPSVVSGVKKETLILVGLACLLVGFLLGVAYSAYKSPQLTAGGAGGGSQQAQAPGKLSPEQTQQLLQLELQVQKDPKNLQALTSLGHLYFDSDQYEKAIDAYTRSLALSPSNPDVLTDLGVMYRNVGKAKEAIESFDKAIALNDRHETARFNKGVVLLYDLKDQAGAIKAWEELVRVNPKATAPNGQPVSDILQEMTAAK